MSQYLYCFIAFLISISYCKVECLSSDTSIAPNLPLHVVETLDDIEALAFFVLYRKNYVPSPSDQEGQTEFLLANQTLEERVLHKFMVELKGGKLLRKKSNESIPCEQLQLTYIDYLQNKNLQVDEKLKDKLMVICEASRTCQSAADLVGLLNLRQESLSTSAVSNQLSLNQALVRLCPVILFQLNEESCALNREDKVLAKLKPSAGAVWGFGLLFVTIISFCSLVGVALLPFLDRKSFLTVLNVCEGLAVGSLVGSALFHLIPQSFNLLTQDGKSEYLWKALIIFGGIYLFYWSERIMKIMVEVRKKKKFKDFALASITEVSEAQRETERHVSFDQVENSASNGVVANTAIVPAEQKSLIVRNSQDKALSQPAETRDRSRSNSFATHRVHNHGHGSAAAGDGEIATVAWMIIFGDGLHNFIDGLSIGAAFSESILAGISISVAVICEEFPHELGDFAVLISSGMSMRQAIGYNFLSACTCYLGLAAGILLGDFAQGSTYILALAGGMFLYIALVDMMGELSTALDEASQVSISRTIHVLILQNIGILLGISTLFLLAKYSSQINFEGMVPVENRHNPLLTI